ncbi:hypothetical protein HQ560_08060, partial [bacterium]|nr:hypothetical protein [bacterium]
LTQHDIVSVPVTVYNYLDEPQDVRLDVKAAGWFALKDSSSKTVRVGPRQVTSVHFQLEARTPGRHALLVSARGTRLADAVERIVRVVPDGRPVVQTVNGRLDENCTQEIVIPSNAIDGASDLVVKIYPGAFSQVVEGMDSIFRMPHGCFEQTSSTTYPNVLVLDYLRRTKQSKPAIEMKALNFINLGCQRLLSYEVKGGGFEWFGKSPAHTVLTAYGLMEFSDMARVHSVDPAVIRRTRRWLLAQQRNDGTWAPAQLHHASSHGRANAGLRTTAYIAWAIAQSGDTGGLLGPTFDYIVRSATRTQDTYILALCANALLAADRTEAQAVLKRLDSLVQREDKLAWWTSAGQGATFSRGNTLDIETTALAASAYLKAGYQTSTAQKALAWLIEQKDSRGTWRSTQATVHAMRALLAGAGATGSVEETLHVAVTANGALAKDLTITPETSDVYRLISLRPMVKEGANRITLETAGAGDLAYQIVATHYVPWAGPPPQAQKPIAIDVQYDTTTLKTHDLLTCRVAVRYNRPGAANMTLVDLGIPPGFEVLAGDFEALKAKGVIERYSLTGRQATLYFRTIESGRPVEFTWRLRAKFPVKVKTPRSTVYQYYEPDVRDETQPVELHVL